jgi:hypothetical protein
MAYGAADSFDIKAHAQRWSRAKMQKSIWDSYIRECYDYAIPFRRPTTSANRRTDVVFDVTAIDSTFRGAGQLKEDLFPSGQPFFKLTPGPLARSLIKAAGDDKDAILFARQLQQVTEQILPHFQTGQFDLAAAEMCLDIFAGTGVLLPVKGDRLNPVRWLCLPMEECTLMLDGFRQVNGLQWERMWLLSDIKAAYRDWPMPEELAKRLADNPNAEVKLLQEFCKEGDRWRCIARIDGREDPPLRTWWRKAQPFVAARYHVVPGETYGRGPVVLALSSIKVVNKVKEMALRSAAINLLGIWGFRPGGAFNPSVHKLQPGAFWPVNSTGGMLGSDVTRLDPPSRALEVANITLSDERAIIQKMLHDEQTDGKGKTPRSAEEVLMIAQRIKRAYVGAFGRLINEIFPVMIPAVCEILYEQKLLTMDLTFDQLLLGVEVTSPLAATMKAGHLEPIIQAIQLISAMGRDPNRELVLDELLPSLLQDNGIPPQFIADEAHKKDFDQKAAAAQAAAVMAEMATKNPEMMMGGGDPAAAGDPAGGNVVPMRGAA